MAVANGQTVCGSHPQRLRLRCLRFGRPTTAQSQHLHGSASVRPYGCRLMERRAWRQRRRRRRASRQAATGFRRAGDAVSVRHFRCGGGAGEIRTRERGTPVTAFPVRTPETAHV